MALTRELEGKAMLFAWPSMIPLYPRMFGFKVSDFGIQSIESALFAADANPESAERKALELLQKVVVELCAWDKTSRTKEVGGVKQYREVVESVGNGRTRKRMVAVEETRSRYGVREGEGTTRLPNSVNAPAAYIRDGILDWEFFKDLAPRLLFLEDEGNPGVPLHPNDEAQWKKAHKDAVSNANPKRKAALELLKKVKSGEYEPWNGRD